MLIAITLSLFFYSLGRHAECQWDACRSKRRSWHLHSRCLKMLVKVIMGSSTFGLYRGWTARLLMHFNFQPDWSSHGVSRFCANDTQSLGVTKTAFHGALQINVVWLMGYFPECVSFSVHTPNTYCADWQAVWGLLIQICSAESVQKVFQPPDWKD